jgi:hypothetical protein
MTQLLTAPEVYSQDKAGHRFMVELASNELELDAWGVPVPKHIKVVDVVVSEPTLEALAQLIAASEWLQGYELVSFWQPEDSAPF